MYLLDSISGIKTKVGLIRNRKKNGTKRTPK
jgi:hypothetical protein